jgi:integrase
MKAALERRLFVIGELAAGRDPAHALAELTKVVPPAFTIATWTTRYLDSRLDIDANTKRNYTSILTKIGTRWGTLEAPELTVDEIAAWVAELAATKKPGTVSLHLTVLRMLLDYVGLDPNPARDGRIRLPKQVREEPNPPPVEHLTAILEALGPRWRLLFITIEQGALRLGEAVNLRWGDVDQANLRLRLPKSATKRDTSRWVYLPEWLINSIDLLCPLEDRTPERRVFLAAGTEASAYQAFTRACTKAKVPHYHPHDLRHRRITVWHQSGVPARELAERAGHARPSMSLDVYSHVMPATELPVETLQALLEG